MPNRFSSAIALHIVGEVCAATFFFLKGEGKKSMPKRIRSALALDTAVENCKVVANIVCYSLSAYVSIRQHTSAYVSIRQHTSASAAHWRWILRARTARLLHIWYAERHVALKKKMPNRLSHGAVYCGFSHAKRQVAAPLFPFSIRQHTSAYVCT